MQLSFVIPQRSVREGLNIVAFERRHFGPIPPLAEVVSLAIEPDRASAP